MKLTEEKLQNLFDYATDGIVIVDPLTGRFMDCNVNAHKRLGYEKEEFLKLTVSDLHEDLSQEDIKKIFQKQILGKSMHIETIHTRKDGTRMPVGITSTLIKLGDQEVLQSAELAVQSIQHNDQNAALEVINKKENIAELVEVLLARKAKTLGRDQADELETARIEISLIDKMSRSYTLSRRIAKITVPPEIDKNE